VSYNSVSNKYTITSSNPETPTFITFDKDASLFNQLGFSNGVEYGFVGGSLESVNSIAIPHINKLFVKSNCCGSTYNNLLMELYVVSAYSSTSYIYWENSGMIDIYSKAFTQSNDNVYQFIITDSRGEEIDFQGQEVCFSVIFYKKNSTDEAVLQNIKADNLEKILQ
jgi:hypothetical protein